MPRPCRALIGWGSPKPRLSISQAPASRPGPSTLLAATSTGVPARCSSRATVSSSPVSPTTASTTKRTASASRTACSAWALTLPSRPAAEAIHPPVSTSVNRRPSHSAVTALRSRVTPGRSCTMASRRPRMRLTSVDLPTLGRPITATTPTTASGTDPDAAAPATPTIASPAADSPAADATPAMASGVVPDMAAPVSSGGGLVMGRLGRLAGPGRGWGPPPPAGAGRPGWRRRGSGPG